MIFGSLAAMINDFLRDSCSIKNTSAINDLLQGSCCTRYLAALRRTTLITNVSCYIWEEDFKWIAELVMNCCHWIWVYLEPCALLQDHLLFTRTPFMTRTICHSPPLWMFSLESKCNSSSRCTSYSQVANVWDRWRWPSFPHPKRL